MENSKGELYFRQVADRLMWRLFVCVSEYECNYF